MAELWLALEGRSTPAEKENAGRAGVRVAAEVLDRRGLQGMREVQVLLDSISAPDSTSVFSPATDSSADHIPSFTSSSSPSFRVWGPHSEPGFRATPSYTPQR